MEDDLESYWAEVRVPWVAPPPDPDELEEKDVFWVGLYSDPELTVECSVYERERVIHSALETIAVSFPAHDMRPTTIYGAGVWTSRRKGRLVFKLTFTAAATVSSGMTLRANISHQQGNF
jgi:hypothetical protein